VGMSLGVAIASGAFAARLASAKAAGLLEAPAYLLAARQTLAVGAVFAALSLACALASPGVRAERPPG